MGHRYVPEAARGVRWDDPAFAIEWPAARDGGSSPRRIAPTRTSNREPGPAHRRQRIHRQPRDRCSAGAGPRGSRGRARAAPTSRGVTWHEVDLLELGAPRARPRQVRDRDPASRMVCRAPGSFWSAPENERWVDASLRLLRAFGEAGGRRAVLAGTCAEYAWWRTGPAERSTPLDPATLYGACKHGLTSAAAAICPAGSVSRSHGGACSSSTARARTRAGSSPSIVRAACSPAKQVPMTDGLQRRDFLHVRDVAQRASSRCSRAT